MRGMAFAPAHVTGLFAPHFTDDPLRAGSRGAGFCLAAGVTTVVDVLPANRTRIQVTINRKPVTSAPVTQRVIQHLLEARGGHFHVTIEHRVDVPIGAGFGTSGAGAIGTALAGVEALRLSHSRLDALQIAHVAEVQEHTGLGTVLGAARGGVEMRVSPGAPGIGEVRRIRAARTLRPVTLHLGPLPTRRLLTRPRLITRIVGVAGALLRRLERRANVASFLEVSREFATRLGLMSLPVRKAVSIGERLGFTCSMAMFGDTAFTLAAAATAPRLARAWRDLASAREVRVFKLDFQGARWL